jgi:hypothetical protein
LIKAIPAAIDTMISASSRFAIFGKRSQADRADSFGGLAREFKAVSAAIFTRPVSVFSYKWLAATVASGIGVFGCGRFMTSHNDLHTKVIVIEPSMRSQRVGGLPILA